MVNFSVRRSKTGATMPRVAPLVSPGSSVRSREEGRADGMAIATFELPADALVCPICMNSLKATVHMCNEGHSFCQDCLARALPARGQRKCPVCRCPVRNPPAVNYSLQELIRRQVVECSHCKARMTRKERIETNHKAQCPERPVSCTASLCNWKGVQREWADHKAGCLDCKVASAIKPLRATVTELTGHLEQMQARVLALEGGELISDSEDGEYRAPPREGRERAEIDLS